MHKRFVSLALCMLLLAFVLTGCGNSGNTDKARTLVFSHADVANQEVYKTLADQYMQEHTGLTIEVQAIAPDNYTETWLKSVSDKKLADVFAVPAGEDFEKFVETDKLLDLSKSSILPEAYDSTLAQIGSRDGHIWAIPVTGSMPVVFFNKAYYEQSQLFYPQTISDFIVNCSILQQVGILPFAMSKDDNGRYDTADLVEGILANGPRDTPLLTSAKFFEKNVELDSGFIDMVGLTYELTIAGMLNTKDNSAQGHQALLEQFANGAYAMIPGDTQDIKTLREVNSDFSFGFFAMPGSSGSINGVFKADMMLGISKSSKVSADAEGFINYLLSASSQELLCNKTLSIPVLYNVTPADLDLANAQKMLMISETKNISLFQRLSKTNSSICIEKLDLAFSGSADDLDVFMQDWTNKLKAIT